MINDGYDLRFEIKDNDVLLFEGNGNYDGFLVKRKK